MSEEQPISEPISPMPESVPSEGNTAAAEPQAGPHKAFKIERKRKRRIAGILGKLKGGWQASLRADVLSMLAALLGVMSLALPWIHQASGYHGADYQLWHYLSYRVSQTPEVFGLVIATVLLGSLLVLFTRAGGLIMLAGIISFLTISMPSEDSYSVGFYFSVAGTGLGLVAVVIRRPIPIPDRLRTITRSHEDQSATLNVMALVAAAIAAVALFITWFEVSFTVEYSWGETSVDNYTFFQFANPTLYSEVLLTAVVCFVVGTLILLITPLGFVGQLSGMIMFVMEMNKESYHSGQFSSVYYNQSAETIYAVGFYLGLLSVSLAIVSIIVGWRLRVSKRRVPLVLPLLITPVSVSTSSAREEPKKVQWTGLAAVARQSIRAMVITIVVLVALVAAAGLSYEIPFSDAKVSISNSNQESKAHVAVYIDGTVKAIEDVYYGTYYEGIFKVKAGTHRLAIDYGFPEANESTDLDGAFDWTTSFDVAPLRTSYIGFSLGYTVYERPIINMDVTEYGNGWKLTAASFSNDMQWIPDRWWGGYRIVLHDGLHNSEWEPSSDMLDNRTYCEQVFNPKSLGTVNVTCEVTDIAGDGQVSIGDFILITSGDDSQFSSTVSYTMYLVYEAEGSVATNLELQGRY